MSSGRGNPPLYCSELVRTTDHEHYVATLVLPEKLRTASFALRALGSEVAGIRDSVSDRTLGMVRTQFWKDAVSNMFQEGKAVPNHPVVTEVKRLVDTSRLSAKLLQVSNHGIVGLTINGASTIFFMAHLSGSCWIS